MVLAGSVGLAHIVKGINRLALINDLHEQNLPPLAIKATGKDTESEADRFIFHLVEGATMQVDAAVRAHLYAKVGQAIPFYLQLLIYECDNLLFDDGRESLTIADVDLAWESILSQHKHFEDADQRLHKYFPNDYPYFLEILKRCAHNGEISIQEVFDIATGLKTGSDYKGKIDDVLVRDGYLVQNEMKFVFVSPLLQAWWKNRHPVLAKKKK